MCKSEILLIIETHIHIIHCLCLTLTSLNMLAATLTLLPRLTSGGYEDKFDAITPSQHIVHRGWRMLMPHEDKVDVITPVNILFIGGGKFWCLMKIKLMIMMMVMVMHDDDDDDDDDCKCGATSGLGANIVLTKCADNCWWEQCCTCTYRNASDFHNAFPIIPFDNYNISWNCDAHHT